ncbi:MAG: amino acid ABC transporter permease [Chloroflexi bacterium]|nr:amino acid ABC transporter permease [Chloroflexota bacterium]
MTEQSLSEDRAQTGSELVTSNIERPGTGFDRWWLLVVGVAAIIVLLVLVRPDPYRRIITFVSDGILVTVGVTVVSFVLMLIVGLFGGLGRLSRNKFIRGIATLYVEVIRGIPLLVQLLMWYFAFPALIKDLGRAWNYAPFANYLADPVGMAVLGLTICYGAYMSEIYRAGIQSISKGQMEAARSLGMSSFQAMRYVILPQAVRVILPPVGNEFISLLKDSSLISVVAVSDLTRRGREFMGATALPIPTWIMVALLYLVMTLLSARVVQWIEQRNKTQER